MAAAAASSESYASGNSAAPPTASNEAAYKKDYATRAHYRLLAPGPALSRVPMDHARA